ncbi:MAG: GntR family transcriptional regulator [Pirellulales bacterium]|nr:GntR family transcriptional regulator [Pirellulales bacterium]
MALEFEIDPSSDVPVYRQVVEKITALVRSGILQPGDRLPPERELAKRLAVARGTVTKAYEELARSGLIDVAQGRGSFVSSTEDAVPSGRKQRAIELIHAMLNEVGAQRFSLREIRGMVDLAIMERETRLQHFHVAMIDCNSEALGIFSRQLKPLSWIPIGMILLNDLAAGSDPAKRLDAFDLVITTVKHYGEVLALAPGLKDRLVQVAVAPSQETIVSLAGLKSSQAVGILCESPSFGDVIQRKLEELGIAQRVDRLVAPWDAERFEEFVAGRDVLIAPPGFTAALDRVTASVVAAFTEGGGRIIPFDFQIERGSLVHLEERIHQLKER